MTQADHCPDKNQGQCVVSGRCLQELSSNSNDNPDTLGNAMSQKEEVATDNEEPQVRYIQWAKNLSTNSR